MEITGLRDPLRKLISVHTSKTLPPPDVPKRNIQCAVILFSSKGKLLRPDLIKFIYLIFRWPYLVFVLSLFASYMLPLCFFVIYLIMLCSFCYWPTGCWPGMLTHWGRGHLNCLNAPYRGLFNNFNTLNAELNPICYLLALLAHHFLHVSRIRVKSLTLRLLMSYIYGAPILDVSRSHTTTQHSR